MSVSAEDRGTRLCGSVTKNYRYLALCLYQLKVEGIRLGESAGNQIIVIWLCVYISAEDRGTRLCESVIKNYRYLVLCLYQLKVVEDGWA